MPSNKVISTLVLAIAGISSAWLLSSIPTPQEVALESRKNIITVENPIQIETKDDWKKLLTAVDKDSVTSVAKKNTPSSDNTSITANAARDLVSQYLIYSQDGDFTEIEMNSILNNTISQSKYNESNGAKYLSTNIKIITKSDSQTLQKYKSQINLILKNRSEEVKEDPESIITLGAETKDEAVLKKLDPIIASGKNMIQDLLYMEVPVSAVKIHLDVLNASSRVTNDIENIRYALTDPLKALISASQYKTNISSFQTSLTNLYKYLGNI